MGLFKKSNLCMDAYNLTYFFLLLLSVSFLSTKESINEKKQALWFATYRIN